MYDKETEKILKKDSLYETEQIFGGKHWSQFNEKEEMFFISKFMIDNQTKEEHLKSVEDTYWCIPWNDFINIIEQYGFKKSWSQYFIDDKTKKQEEEIIYCLPKKGLILWAESYTLCGKDINSGYLYCEANIKDVKDYWKYTEGSNCCKDDIIHMQIDIREGLINKIEKISSLPLLNIWTQKQRHLNFMNFVEMHKIIDDDYKIYLKKRDEITQDKIDKCDDGLKDIINNISYEKQ